MKAQYRQEKFNWLKKLGYKITSDESAGWNAEHPTLPPMHFTDRSIGVVVMDDACQLYGWLSLPFDIFKGVIIALLQIPADYNFNKMEHMQEHYGAQFHNLLS